MAAAAQPSWDLYRSFLAVLQHGSLSGAARALGLTQPTVGRHIAELQQMLGEQTLFTRSAAGLNPTAAARELRLHAETMAAAAAALMRTSGGEAGTTAGVVRITASEVISIEVLPPILARLRSAHAGIDVELDVSNAMSDLLRRDADIAIRMAPPKQTSLVAKRIGRIHIGLHAHRRYVEKHGVPQQPDDIAHHTMIGFDTTPTYLRNYRLGVPLRREMFAFRTDNDVAQLAAIRAGLGIGACQYGIARRDADLISVLPGAFRIQLETFIVMHADQRKSKSVKTAFDAVAEGMSQYAQTSAA
jgi:DNA-binding transcriptional LysR family regulator